MWHPRFRIQHRTPKTEDSTSNAQRSTSNAQVRNGYQWVQGRREGEAIFCPHYTRWEKTEAEKMTKDKWSSLAPAHNPTRGTEYTSEIRGQQRAPAFGVRRCFAAFNTQRSTLNVSMKKGTLFVVRCSLFVVRCSLFVVRHSSLVTQ